MQRKELLSLLAADPVIAAVKDDAGLDAAIAGGPQVLFLLYGDILTLPAMTERIRSAGKYAFVHLDLAEGLAAREIAADFIAGRTAADGVISTKAQITRRARERGLLAIQRFFLLDSMALGSIRSLSPDAADLIEVLPGLMPGIIRRVCAATAKPVIAGGLISSKADVIAALGAGAVAVSTSHPEVWGM